RWRGEGSLGDPDGRQHADERQGEPHSTAPGHSTTPPRRARGAVGSRRRRPTPRAGSGDRVRHRASCPEVADVRRPTLPGVGVGRQTEDAMLRLTPSSARASLVADLSGGTLPRRGTSRLAVVLVVDSVSDRAGRAMKVYPLLLGRTKVPYGQFYG